jgi:hypothetical protein
VSAWTIWPNTIHFAHNKTVYNIGELRRFTQPYLRSNAIGSPRTVSYPQLYASDTTPGMFTLGQDPIGAIIHKDGSLVSDENPAQVGETVVLHASGLGSVTAAIADGSAGPAGPLSYTLSPVGVIVGGVQASSVEFAGLAPFDSGLYQIDFVIPARVSPGELNCDLHRQRLPGAGHDRGWIDLYGKAALRGPMSKDLDGTRREHPVLALARCPGDK